MNWTKLLDEKRVAREPTSKKEIDDLRAMTGVHLKDAQVNTVSSQGRYEFAYNAARLMATAVVRASGYRVIAKNGHHYFTFQALQASDAAFILMATYFDRARDKRNDFSYDSPIVISDADAEDLINAVLQFVTDAERWISSKHPALKKTAH
jgi:hypothetical protein